MNTKNEISGILLINKSQGSTSFSLVTSLRKRTNVSKIGHSGTLDPFATGVMVMLIGRDYTKKSHLFLTQDKTYYAKVYLGKSTDTFDIEGKVTQTSDKIPEEAEVDRIIESFQGEQGQIPPMFSAKKKNGKKLYELARKGITIERAPVQVQVNIEKIEYHYPFLELKIHCSKGTYIRSLADDIGKALGTGGHLFSLTRLSSGPFQLKDCIEEADIRNEQFDLIPYLIRNIKNNLHFDDSEDEDHY